MKLFWRPLQPMNAVLVTTKTDRSIRGVLVDQRRDALILRAAAVVAVDKQGNVSWQALDGDIVVPLENVDYYQEALDPELVLT